MVRVEELVALAKQMGIEMNHVEGEVTHYIHDEMGNKVPFKVRSLMDETYQTVYHQEFVLKLPNAATFATVNVAQGWSVMSHRQQSDVSHVVQVEKTNSLSA